MKHLLDQLKKHGHPLLIDAIESIHEDTSIIAIKNVSLSDPIFHSIESVNQAIYPDQSLIESHIQTSLLLLYHQNYLSNHTYKLKQITAFDAIDPVFCGEQIRFETELIKQNDDIFEFQSRSYVNGQERSTMSFSIQQANATTSGTFIHPTASVHSSAILGNNVHIGPYAIVNEQVTIGDNTKIAAHVMIEKWTTIGTNNAIQYGAVIGSEAQDMKYLGEESFVKIGDNNHIREYVTINRATGKGESTILGSDNMILTSTHIGHNCVIGNNITMANVVHISGHVSVGDYTTIGGMTGIHQFVRIGKGCMIGGYSRLPQDIPPFMLCEGNPAYVRNLNLIGCKRRGMSKETIADLRQLFKLLYRSNLNTSQALAEFSPEGTSDEVQHLLDFIKADSSRGIAKKTDNNATTAVSE